MIKNNIEFYNAVQLIPTKHGDLMYRFEEEIIPTLGYNDSKKGQEKAQEAGGIEIRFLSDTEEAEITLYSWDKDIYITGFIGDYQYGTFLIKKETNSTVKISLHERFKNFKFNDKRRYSSTLFRFLISGGSRVSFVGVNTSDFPITVPKKENLPKLNILAYGSSITYGVGTTTITNSYIMQMANLLNIDVLNKGMSGSCLLEKNMVDSLARNTSDAYFLELGCNVRGIMELDEFENRLQYLLKTLSKTKKPIIIFSLLPYFSYIYRKDSNEPYKEKNISFANAIKKYAEQFNALYIPGDKIIYDPSCCSYDMLHPSEYGHLQIALALVETLKKKL